MSSDGPGATAMATNFNLRPLISHAPVHKELRLRNLKQQIGAHLMRMEQKQNNNIEEARLAHDSKNKEAQVAQNTDDEEATVTMKEYMELEAQWA